MTPDLPWHVIKDAMIYGIKQGDGDVLYLDREKSKYSQNRVVEDKDSNRVTLVVNGEWLVVHDTKSKFWSFMPHGGSSPRRMTGGKGVAQGACNALLKILEAPFRYVSDRDLGLCVRYLTDEGEVITEPLEKRRVDIYYDGCGTCDLKFTKASEPKSVKVREHDFSRLP